MMRQIITSFNRGREMLRAVGTVGDSRALVRSAGGTLIMRIAGAAVGLGVQILLARYLTVAAYGVYSIVLAVLFPLTMVTKLGLDAMLVRFIAVYRSQEAWGLLRGVISRSIRYALFSSVVGSAVLALVVWSFRTRIDTELGYTLLIGCAAVPLMTLVSMRAATLRGLERVVTAAAGESLVQPLALVVLVVPVFVLRPDLRAGPTAMAIHVGSLLLVLGWFSIYALRGVSDLFQSAVAQTQTRSWFGVALPLMLLATFAEVNTRADLLMVGTLLGQADAGIYAAASRLSKTLLWGIGAVNMIAAPMIARLYAGRDMVKLQKVASSAALGGAAFALPLAAGLIVAGKPLLALFGVEYIVGYGPLVVLAVGAAINGLVGSTGWMLGMTGKHREAALIMASTVVLNVLLNLGLIPILGLLGAAIATTAGTLLWTAAMYVRIRKHLGIDPTVFSVVRIRRNG